MSDQPSGKMLVDTKCVELAEHFLHGERNASDRAHRAEVQALAEEIQGVVEGWFVLRNYQDGEA